MVENAISEKSKLKNKSEMKILEENNGEIKSLKQMLSKKKMNEVK